MAENKLDLIRRYCDTTGIRLHDWEKDLLCKVLSNPSCYDGFESRIFIKEDSGRDYRDTWSNSLKWQYRIRFIDGMLRILQRSLFQVSDGYEVDRWDWDKAVEITDTRSILTCLEEMEQDL